MNTETLDPRMAVAIRAACVDRGDCFICQFPECGCTILPPRIHRALSALDAHAREQGGAMRTPGAERQVRAHLERRTAEAVPLLREDIAGYVGECVKDDEGWPSFKHPGTTDGLAAYLARAGWRRTGRSE